MRGRENGGLKATWKNANFKDIKKGSTFQTMKKEGKEKPRGARPARGRRRA